ncbi:MAG: S49 family peptidase, partial [Candidatus Krumholzibacteriota bacterium]|nr:S49 family peptidase [Candidatus Krumholzibacteriota bacterium]
ENEEWILADVWSELVDALREDRGLTETQVTALMEEAEFGAARAREAGLIDGILYWDELAARLKGEDDDELRTVSMGRYADVDFDDLDMTGKKKIAVVHAQGTIGGRQSGVNPLLGIMMGHESVCADLRRAREDEDVAAIVFRVNSGGGDALTSDLIGHEVEITAAEKPVVVSMVDVAASGGYHVAYRATRMLADGNTITGSIGSISGKFVMKGLYDKLGLTHSFVTRGPNALMWSSVLDFTDEQWEIHAERHWADFNDWLRDVAERRGMSFAEAEKLAHGRVWTGRQAAGNGLVDEVGGLDRAVALARELAEVPEKDKVTVVHYPVQKGLLESILSGEGDLTLAARALVYRMIREDVVETWNLVATNPRWYVEELRVH